MQVTLGTSLRGVAGGWGVGDGETEGPGVLAERAEAQEDSVFQVAYPTAVSQGVLRRGAGGRGRSVAAVRIERMAAMVFVGLVQ